MKIFQLTPYPLSSQRNVLPRWMCNYSFACFAAALLACFVVWNKYAMPMLFALISIGSVVLFFFLGHHFSVKWVNFSQRTVAIKILQVSFLLRLLWGVFTYYFNVSYFGTPVGSMEDTGFYIAIAKEFVYDISHFDFSFFNRWTSQYGLYVDDLGYPIFLGTIYLLTFSLSDVFIPFMVKALLGAYTCYCIFQIANRHFGIKIAKLSGLFCALNPNMIWWCGSMMKETEMVFLLVLFVNLMDNALLLNQRNFWKILPAILVGLLIFLYRAALGAVAFLAILSAVVLSTNKIVSLWKKVLTSILVICILMLGLGDYAVNQASKMVQNVQEGGQKTNMEWRSTRQGGNSFAKYAGAAVFAPLIFTLPFPTLTAANADQFSQMQLSGGNYIKNILSFFVILALLILLLSGDWKNHVFPTFFMLGYLAVLVLSGYAQSGRFHMPIWPFEMMFAAYGICMLPRAGKRWFNYVLIFEFIICIGWQWFKLKGRGMI